jgi:hypothetical protein
MMMSWKSVNSLRPADNPNEKHYIEVPEARADDDFEGEGPGKISDKDAVKVENANIRSHRRLL